MLTMCIMDIYSDVQIVLRLVCWVYWCFQLLRLVLKQRDVTFEAYCFW